MPSGSIMRKPIWYGPLRPEMEDPQYFMAWVPVYTDLGERTRIFYTDGRKEDVDITIRTLLRRTTAHSGCSPALLRQGGRRRLYCPLPLEQTVLIPLKLRLPRCRRDNTVGYVSLQYIQGYGAREDCAQVLPDGAESYCLLSGNVVLPIYWKIRTVSQHINAAMAVYRPTSDADFAWYHLIPLLQAFYEWMGRTG